MAAVQQDGMALQYVEEQTLEICMAAVQQDGRALQCVEEQTLEICMDAVQENGLALEYVKEQTPEICLAAVQQNGHALKYVKEQTPEICLTARQQLACYTLCSPSDDICPICQDDESTDDQWCDVNNCKHKFHIGCIEGWLLLQKTCPKCRGCLI